MEQSRSDPSQPPLRLTHKGCSGPPLAIVVVNYRTPDLTVDCLRSLAPEVVAIPGCRVVVVENGSGDDSAEHIRTAIDQQGWQSWVSMLELDQNLGFAGGNNRGIREYLDARYILLLNSDTIVHRGCLCYCSELMEQKPGIGAMSCRLLNRDGSVQNVARRFPSPLRLAVRATRLPWRLPRLFGWADTEDLGWDRNSVKRDVDWLGGAFLWIRGDVLRQVGLLDEDFFFEGEDVEFCHRVWNAGLRCHYDPGAAITHLGGSSSDPTRMSARARSVHRWRARYLVLSKCYGPWASWLVRCLDIVACWLRILRVYLTRGTASQEYSDSRAILRLLCGKLERTP